jgi:hypothetical protein
VQHLIAMFASAGSLTGTVTVSGDNVGTTAIGGGAQEGICGFQWRADGTVWEFTEENGGGRSYNQVDSATDWILPNVAGARTYYIQFVQNTYVENESNPSIFGTKSWNDGGDAETTWHTIGNGVEREVYLITNSNSAGAGDVDFDVDVSIATDSGGTNILDTGFYSMNVLVG